MRLGPIACSVLLLMASAPPGDARDLVMGAATEQPSLDPHFSRSTNSYNMAGMLFDRLVEPDENLQMTPSLALSWHTIDPLTWRITLRSGVVFHDGSPLTADDVTYSLERVKHIANSPASMADLVAAVASTRVVDKQTVEIKTREPTPDLMEQIAGVFIVSKKNAEGKTQEDFNKGTAAIGSGPYKFISWRPGDRAVLVRNDKYWKGVPEFETVTIRYISNGAARIAALRTGAVDVIDAVPPADVKPLSTVPGIKVSSIASTRLVYMAVDSARDTSPWVTDLDGKPLTPNPLRNPGVRLALSKMINRKLIADRLLDGAAEPAGQIVPAGLGGFNPALAPEAYDVAGAKTLLAEAGYPKGFGITIHSSSDRLPNDGQVAQALGQMFAQGGLKVNGVVALPYSTYVPAANRQSYSLFIFSYGNGSPSSAVGLRANLMTYDAAAGTGTLNRARYSNPAFDAKMRDAMSQFDETARNGQLAEATKMAFAETGIIPLYWQVVSWASRDGFAYTANRSEEFRAMNAHVTK